MADESDSGQVSWTESFVTVDVGNILYKISLLSLHSKLKGPESAVETFYLHHANMP